MAKKTVYFGSVDGYKVEDYPIEIEPLTDGALLNATSFYCGAPHPIFNMISYDTAEDYPVKHIPSTAPIYTDPFSANVTLNRLHFAEAQQPKGIYMRVIFTLWRGATAPRNLTVSNSTNPDAYVVTNIKSPNKLVLLNDLSNITSKNNQGYTYGGVVHCCNQPLTNYRKAPMYIYLDSGVPYRIIPYFVIEYRNELTYLLTLHGCTVDIYGGEYLGDRVSLATASQQPQSTYSNQSIRYMTALDSNNIKNIMDSMTIRDDETFCTPTGGMMALTNTQLNTRVNVFIDSNNTVQRVGRVRYEVGIDDVEASHCAMKVIFGMYFVHNDVLYKPIIKNSIVLGYSLDLNKESDIDDWDDFNHEVPDKMEIKPKITPVRKKIVMRTIKNHIVIDKPFTEGVALSKIYSNGESQIIRVDNAGLIKLQAIQDGRYQLVGKLYGETEYTPIAMINTNGINNVRYGINTDVYAADISGFECIKVIVYYGCDTIYAKTDNVVMKYAKTITNKIILHENKYKIILNNKKVKL